MLVNTHAWKFMIRGQSQWNYFKYVLLQIGTWSLLHKIKNSLNIDFSWIQFYCVAIINPDPTSYKLMPTIINSSCFLNCERCNYFSTLFNSHACIHTHTHIYIIYMGKKIVRNKIQTSSWWLTQLNETVDSYLFF